MAGSRGIYRLPRRMAAAFIRRKSPSWLGAVQNRSFRRLKPRSNNYCSARKETQMTSWTTVPSRLLRSTFVAAKLVAVLSLAIGSVAAADRPPNFVVIFCDDLGYADIGPFGAKGYATPHLDRMARE